MLKEKAAIKIKRLEIKIKNEIHGQGRKEGWDHELVLKSNMDCEIA